MRNVLYFSGPKVLNNDIKGTENFIPRENSIIPPGLVVYCEPASVSCGILFFFPPIGSLIVICYIPDIREIVKDVLFFELKFFAL